MLSPRHRLVLSCLLAHGGSTSVVRLARHVAAHLAYEPPESVSRSETRRLFVAVRSHLDDLSGQGLVEYCETEGTVTLAVTEDALGPGHSST